MKLKKIFYDKIVLNYHLYKSILLTLPFSDIEKFGVMLSMFTQSCEKGIKNQKPADKIIDDFFNNELSKFDFKEKSDALFKFIQFIERQITIFDSLEDAAFEDIHETHGGGTLDYFLNLIKSQWKFSELDKKIRDFKIMIVLTAHPTQFYSTNVLGILHGLTVAFKKKDVLEVRDLLKQLGKTNFYNRDKLTPIEEAKTILIYLRKVFYHNIPLIVEKLESEIRFHIGSNHQIDNLENFIKIGFWPGGDRDGNPYVTAETTSQVARLLKNSIISCYIKDLKKLQKSLTFIGTYDLIKKVIYKLRKTGSNNNDGYSDFKEFHQEILDIKKNLIEKHESLFIEKIDYFIRKINSFHFYFANLDIRQDSTIYTSTVKEIYEFLLAKEYSSLTDKEKIEFLLNPQNLKEKNLTSTLINHQKFSSITIDTLKTLVVSFEIQKKNGIAGLHRYIISNTQSIVNILEVYFLLQLFNPNKKLNFDIIPLFETMKDLDNVEVIMNSLYKIPEYYNHLESRDKKQIVMLGFSDGTKDGGYIAANWSIFTAKEKITTISRKFNIKVIFFDGRGGPPARGGGETNKFYSSLGEKIENHEIQLTVQGQTISSKYGTDKSFRYNIEQLLIAGLEEKIFGHKQNNLDAKQKLLLDEMAKLSFKAYGDLKEHPLFKDYLSAATPLLFYGQANIGSRPSKRNKDASISLNSLRAIPFVSSWNQIKQNIPAYYGLGIAIEEMIKNGKDKEIINLYKSSLFFRTLLGNSMQSLLKSNLNYTIHLKNDDELSSIWNKINDETILTKKMILSLMDKKVEENKKFFINNINEHSILFREKIVSPLVVIQQYALIQLLNNKRGKLKLSDEDIKKYGKIIIRSMPGIINAARNSA